MKLELLEIHLPLADFAVEINLTLTSQVTALAGPSGAGKTSLLDLIAGLRRPRSARVVLDDRVLTDTAQRIHVPPHARRIGYVPQDLALFPHLSVRQNLLYGHRAEDESAHGGLFSYAHVTTLLDIAGLAARSITHLSGGEKQRVALGRALLASPQLLLLDEPMANLDRALKARILPYLTRIRDEFRLPMIYVTHDLEEVRPLCEQVLTLERGQLITPTPPPSGST